MKLFRLSRSAKADLAEITDYVAADNPQAAQRILDAILARLKLLGSHPGIGQRCEQFGPAMRRFVVGSYVIYYQPISTGISVVRVLHSARDVDDILGRTSSSEGGR